jgi:hypothetical protein
MMRKAKEAVEKRDPDDVLKERREEEEEEEAAKRVRDVLGPEFRKYAESARGKTSTSGRVDNDDDLRGRFRVMLDPTKFYQAGGDSSDGKQSSDSSEEGDD